MASRLFAVDLDLGLNKAKRFVFEDFATNPDTNLASGRVIFWTANDSDDNHLKVYDGDSWEVLAYKSDLTEGVTYSISSETGSGGANLRLTGSNSSTDNVLIAGGTNVTVTRTDANTITIDSTDTDTNTTYSISAETATGGANLRLTDSAAGTDDVKLAGSGSVSVARTDANTITITGTDNNTTYDLAAGGTTSPTISLSGSDSSTDTVTFAAGTGISLGQSTGTITITNTVSDTNTTYSVSAESTTGGANLRLTDSGAGTDDVKFAGSGATTVTRTDANTITISSTDTNTTYTAGTGLNLSGTEFQNTGVLSVTGTANEITVSGTGSDPYTGAITIGLPDNVTIGGALTVTGDLTVNGNTTTLNTATLSVEDNIVLLNNGVTGVPSLNAGLEVERGDYTNATLYWNETANLWYTGTPGDSTDAVTAHSVARKYAVNLSSANETSAGVFSISHGLGTRDVTVYVYSLNSPYASVECQVEHATTSAVTITFNTDPGDDNYRVVVTG